MSVRGEKWHTGLLEAKVAARAARQAQRRLIAEVPVGDETTIVYLVLGYLEVVPNHGRCLGWWGEMVTWPLRCSVFA